MFLLKRHITTHDPLVVIIIMIHVSLNMFQFSCLVIPSYTFFFLLCFILKCNILLVMMRLWKKRWFRHFVSFSFVLISHSVWTTNEINVKIKVDDLWVASWIPNRILNKWQCECVLFFVCFCFTLLHGMIEHKKKE